MAATSRACSQGATGAISPQNYSKVFRPIKYLKYEAKKYSSENQRSFLKKAILFQLLIEYKLLSDLL